MPDSLPTPASPAPDPTSSQGAPAPAPSPQENAGAAPQPALAGQQSDFDIGEEYGTARKNLPPIWILAICIVVVVAGVAIYAATHRAHAESSGTIDSVVDAAIPGQNAVMIAINVSLHNNELKPAWIKSIHVAADAGGKVQEDDAAPAVDAQGYLEAMPALKEHALQILKPEMRINPGEQISGTVVVSFPITPEIFAARKSLTVTVTPYDEMPIVLKK